MIAISGSQNVMQFFPAAATPQQTKDFIERMKILCNEKGYCYFAVDLLKTNEFIGFIGLNDITYKTSFSPATDIGWRLAEKYWRKGYATEGALACLNYAKSTLKIDRLISTAPAINKPSISVMQKIGMVKLTEFKHPRLLGHTALENCVCYEIEL
jgi:RimJ/RimL family protein N-acetyltransferase